jgi:hypothetical protein
VVVVVTVASPWLVSQYPIVTGYEEVIVVMELPLFVFLVPVEPDWEKLLEELVDAAQ